MTKLAIQKNEIQNSCDLLACEYMHLPKQWSLSGHSSNLIAYVGSLFIHMKSDLQCPVKNWFAKESLNEVNKVFLFRRSSSIARIKDHENKFEI